MEEEDAAKEDAAEEEDENWESLAMTAATDRYVKGIELGFTFF